MSTQGCMFFNFGSKCALRLLVALNTLRRYYKGNVIVMLAKDDPANESLVEDLKRLEVDYRWFEMERLTKRHLKSVLKPNLFRISEYDTTLMFDGDLCFKVDPSVLFPAIEGTGSLVTHFNGWWSNQRKISRRLHTIKHALTEEELAQACERHEAVNIGVMGYHKSKGDNFLNDWERITIKAAGTFIADELAAQACFFKHNSSVISGNWNTSCNRPSEFELAKIVHYHGEKHTNPARYASRYWWHNVFNILNQEKTLPVERFKYWLKQDKNANGVFRHHGKWKLINICGEEFRDGTIPEDGEVSSESTEN